MTTNNAININNVCKNIDNCINEFLTINGIENDYKTLVSVKHSTINYMFSYIYERLFKPDHNLPNNQKSLIDYNDVELLQVLADKFNSICQRFNKSLGVMSFCYMVGVRYDTVYSWLHNPESNPERIKVIKSIQENHKVQQIALLNDTPVGALAVANNDVETGLNWSANQVQQITNNTVYYLPSERSNKLQLDKIPE
jgi:hypothetical protein